jgi:ABC-type multidrug transport system fused ATPase/permease subunit
VLLCCLQMGLVSQDCLLFHGTIEDNIRYGTEHATSVQVEEAARAAYAHDFIMAMPHVSVPLRQQRRCADCCC